MTQSDLEQLLAMGFDKERAELAIKQSGGRTFLPPFLHDISPNTRP